MHLTEKQKEVRNFWKTEACGTHFIEDYEDKKDFYDKYREFCYRTEWHIPLLIPFAEGKGKKVLEIGCGNGADGIMFALNGAHYTGVDLTETAVEATREHFEIMDLKGTFKTEDAENLSFQDGTFDMVYSFGVLHHTPSPSKAFKEVFRVLKKGGKTIIMLYHRNSFNYYVRILFYMRLKVLFKIIKRIGKNSKAIHFTA